MIRQQSVGNQTQWGCVNRIFGEPPVRDLSRIPRARFSGVSELGGRGDLEQAGRGPRAARPGCSRSPATHPGRRPSRSPLPRPPGPAARRRRRPRGRDRARSTRRTRPAAVHARSRLAAPTRRRSSTTRERASEHREVRRRSRSLCRNGKPVAGIASCGARVLTDSGAPLRVAPPPSDARVRVAEHRRVHDADDRLRRRARARPTRRPRGTRAGSSRCRRADRRTIRATARSPPLSSPKNAMSGALGGERRRAPRSRSRCRRRSPSRPAPSRGCCCPRRRTRRARPRRRRAPHAPPTASEPREIEIRHPAAARRAWSS